jgi:hypothetical protein
VLAVRWIELPPTEGVRLLLGTGSVSVLGWEREVHAIKYWNTEPVRGRPVPARRIGRQ